VLVLFENEDHAWLDLHGFKQVALSLGFREALHHPAIHLTVRLFQALLHQAADDVVGDGVALILAGLDKFAKLWLVLGQILEEILRGNVDEAELRSQEFGLGGSAGARWTLQDDGRWLPWRLLVVSHSEHVEEVFLDLIS
jgi:hypothetical protein